MTFYLIIHFVKTAHSSQDFLCGKPKNLKGSDLCIVSPNKADIDERGPVY